MPGTDHEIYWIVNDPVPTFKPDPATGTYHWSFERVRYPQPLQLSGGNTNGLAKQLVSLGCIPLTIAPFAAGSLNPVMDAIVVSGLLLHSHMSFKYVAPIPRGNSSSVLMVRL